MTSSPGFTTALVAAIVSALVSLATAGLVLHRAGVPIMAEATGGSVDDAKIHDYLVKNPEILVEMSTELDKRQAEEQDAKQRTAIGKNADNLRSPKPRRGQSGRRRHRGRVLRLQLRVLQTRDARAGKDRG
jgi:hypothetical protein